jgi:hypothetical protein
MERIWRDEIVNSKDVERIIKETGNWRRSKGFETGWHNFGEKIALIISEIDEAWQAKENVEEAYGKFEQCSLPYVYDLSNALITHIENYVEEWIDVMVRVFDLAEACDLPLVIYPRAPELPITINRTVFSAYSIGRVREAIKTSCAALETFRDIDLRLGEVGKGLVPEESEENKKLIESLEHWLSGVASVASWAVQDVGKSWWEMYAEKMEKNEARVPKHGRKR